MDELVVKKFNDTKIPNMFSTGLYTEVHFDVPAEHAYKILDILVHGTTVALSDIKSKQAPVAFKFCQNNGDFIAAAILQYFSNEDTPDQPGNWNYSWTFVESDIPEGVRTVNAYDPQLNTYFRSYAGDKYYLGFYSAEYAGDMFNYMMKTIRKWLDENTPESGTNVVELPGVIQFRTTIEDGKKVMSIEPDGEIKQLIKDDASIEA